MRVCHIYYSSYSPRPTLSVVSLSSLTELWKFHVDSTPLFMSKVCILRGGRCVSVWIPKKKKKRERENKSDTPLWRGCRAEGWKPYWDRTAYKAKGTDALLPWQAIILNVLKTGLSRLTNATLQTRKSSSSSSSSYMSWSWATCWPVPVSRIQKSLERSSMIPSASWGIVFHYPG
jgi:hypothetical protein